MSRPWMPLYVADYLADTGHLQTIEHGAYMLLIMHYWQNGELPPDEAKLARIARMTAKEWAAARDTLSAFFEPDWTHGRVEEELAKAEEVSSKRREAGLAGASARYSNCHSKRKRQPKQTHSLIHTQSQSSDKSEDTSERDFEEWLAAYPRRVSKGRARKAYAAALKKTDAATLLAGAKAAAVKYAQTEPQFIPHPATWLNDERWLDEATVTPSKPDPGQPAAVPWEQRIRAYREAIDAGNARPFWSGFWGPKPDEHSCDAPAEILERYGFGKKAA